MSTLLFNKTHEWASIEGNTAVIGISAHAQQQLGDIVFVELPMLGLEFSQFDRCGTVESTKTASELYAPLSGRVVSVNDELAHNPQWVNEDPYGKGWMMKISLTDPSEKEKLMEEAAYKETLNDS
jgi:glycine cleavage system H protein